MNLFKSAAASATQSSARRGRQVLANFETLDGRRLLNAAMLAVHVQTLQPAPMVSATSHSQVSTPHVVRISTHAAIQPTSHDAVSLAIADITREAGAIGRSTSGTGMFAPMDNPPPIIPIPVLLGSASW